MSLGSGLLLPSAMEMPRFKGKWVAPAALGDMAGAIAPYRIVMITASPGSGKTRLMARLSSHLETSLHVCCWLRLTPGTSGQGTLTRQIAIVLSRSVLGAKSATAALLMAPGVDADVLLAVMLSEVAAFGGEVALFIDDLHAADVAAMGDLQRIVAGAPRNLRIVMASRLPTGLHLARWRNEDALLEIDDGKLAVSFKQVAELIAEAGVPALTLAETRALWARTGGRVAAVRLLARNRLRKSGEGSATGGFAIGRDILEYFEEELFRDLSDAARGALDAMLVPHRLDHDLMVALAGHEDAEAHIQEYRAQGLLTRQSKGAGTTYEAMPLLVDVSRVQSLCSPEEQAALHLRCCDWFEARGQSALAAAHAMDGGDVSRAIELVERCGFAMIAQGYVLELQSWLPRFPVDDLRKRPTALLAVAWALSLLYRLDEAEALVAPLAAQLASDPAPDPALVANLSALQVMVLSMHDDFTHASAQGRLWRARNPGASDWFGRVVDNSIAFCLALTGEVAEARLTLESAYLPACYETNPYATIYARCILGLIDLRDGQVRHAEAHFASALKRAEADMSQQSTGTVMAAGLLAGALYEQNELDRVEQVIEGFAWSLHAHLFTDARFQAYRAKARMLSLRGQYRAAITALETVLDAGPAIRLTRLQVDVLSEKVIVALDHHDTRTAGAYARALSEQRDRLPTGHPLESYVEAAILGSQAHLDIELGAPERALDPLRRAVALDLAGGWNLRAFHHAVLGVRALWRMRQSARALSILRRLVRYAARSGIQRTLIDGGRDIRAMLDAIIAQGWQPADRHQARLMQQLREAFDPSLAVRETGGQRRDHPDSLLTEREIELVRFVRAGLTNRQIAERMRVSENTIKWHLKNIFEKASITRRSELANLALL
ncbi:LuxR C-terminal-related transcriptional regulator [Novosphingobium sp. Leaf2]|uniref:LuxR C-terminal-related transcriptional regulator n=1 Tax=Novosphingobium sp. Leaf2 TaxID=1735670 RepID=UPI0012E302EC|nr:LuxR C-terminal-related transcriptional regulator [Novosphingobium sp. Leaf2]